VRGGLHYRPSWKVMTVAAGSASGALAQETANRFGTRTPPLIEEKGTRATVPWEKANSMRKLTLLLTFLLLSACALFEGDGQPVDISAGQPIDVESPVRVLLVDGTSVVFEDGLVVNNDRVMGQGVLYDEEGDEVGPLTGFPLSDVAAMESYRDVAGAVAATAGAVLLGIGAVIVLSALAVAIFGSCPTVYSLAADVPVLEAELFSYNIAPAFQSRDVDWLGARPDQNGRLSLEIRNEMLETHYIDQLELVEVTHNAGQRAYPGRNGRPVVVEQLLPPVAASDQDGRDVLAAVQQADTQAWSATDERLARVTATDYTDHLYLEFDVPAGVDTPALVLRMRNSMLNTELFYGVMLENQRFGALDWLGKDLNRFTEAMQTGLWYRNTMGLGVEVWDDGRYREVGRIPDQGPIAWAERAIRLPNARPDNGRLKIRLSFVTDNWRFDQVALSPASQPGKTRVIPVDRAETDAGDRVEIPAYLRESDKEYLVTRPGDRVHVHFETGNPDPAGERTFFLASDGYYIEWMRAEWLTGGSGERFRPGTASLLKAINQYAAKRDDYREKFEATRIEVR